MRLLAAGALVVGLSVNVMAASPAEQAWRPIYAAIVYHSLGAGARVDLGDEATVRLKGSLLYVADLPTAQRALDFMGIPVPPDLLGLLRAPDPPDGTDGLVWGTVRFVRAGTVEANEALAWTREDMLASLRATIAKKKKENPNLPPIEVRRWVWPPHYDAANQHLTWAALFVPANSPPETGGEVVFRGLAFGRDGYVEVAMYATAEHNAVARQVVSDFLAGVTFKPGKTFDPSAKGQGSENSLAKAMYMDDFHRAPIRLPVVLSDKALVIVGGAIAVIAALALALYAYRQRRREARRW